MKCATQLILFCCVLFATQSCFGDNRQPVMRFFGTGWGAGYHAYNPRFTAHGFCCTDRYSRPAAYSCQGCSDNYSYQSQNFQMMQYRYPVNQYQQHHQSGQSTGSTLEDLPVPQTNDSQQQKEQQREGTNEDMPPKNSGTKQNPFGVSSGQVLPPLARVPHTFQRPAQYQRVNPNAQQYPSGYQRSILYRQPQQVVPQAQIRR